MKALHEQRDGLINRTTAGPSGHRAAERLRALAESVQVADLPEENADLMHAIYKRITSQDRRSSIVGVPSPRRPKRTDWRWRYRKGCNGVPDRRQLEARRR
jgi:hypothetical protein